MRKVLQFLSRQLEVLKVREKINTQVQEEMGRNQREYVLRQQLKAIKEELGELDEGGGDLDEFKEKITKAKMPAEAEKVARKQLERLKVMQPSSAEYTVTRTYLEWLVELPWSISTEDKLDIEEARDSPRRGPLRPREGEEAHPRVPGGAQAQERQEGPDPVPRRARRASARRRSASRSRRRSAASSCASRSAACATRPRSAATGARTSARCRAASSRASRRRARTTRSSCSTRSTSSGTTSGATRRRRCSRCSIPSRTTRSAITTSRCRSTCRR